MRVKIGPYLNWIGPYQIADMILFWKKPDEGSSVNSTCHAFGKWLSEDKNGDRTYLHRFCEWIHSKRSRTVVVKLDKYDHWSLDSTLSPIIAPLLKQLKENTHGFGYISDEDVPEELRSTNAAPKENEFDWDSNTEARWNWALDEMIYAFDALAKGDWDNKYHANKNFDYENYKIEDARITNGTQLFGKYFRTLWD
jgi:hypothetical protein